MMEETLSICELLSAMPWWYYAAQILFSLYYAIRGVSGKSSIIEKLPIARHKK